LRLGKTLTSITAINSLHAAGHVNNVLVIAPLSIVNTWQQELALHCDQAGHLVIPIVGSKPQRIKALKGAGICQTPLKIFLINPEGILSIEKELENLDFDLVIVDESPLMKSRTAKRSKIIKKLFQNVKFKLILSGNPIPKGGHEIFSQYEFVEPGIFGTAYTKFIDKYFKIDFFKNVCGMQENMREEFDKKFHEIAFVKRKDECLDLPEKIYQPVIIEMGKRQKELYKQMEKEAIVAYNDLTCSATVVLAKFTRLSQIAGGFISWKDDFGNETIEVFDENTKVKQLISSIEELPNDEQIVIWARFVPEINLISEALTKAGISNVKFYGGNRKTRDEEKARFSEGSARAFIGNPAAGGKGINDLVGANYSAYYSNSDSADDRQQSEDRTNRSGSKGNENYHSVYIDLIMKDTIDLRHLETLRSNKNFSDAILERRIKMEV
jgi:SNF2 family DNA or RNA helicase